MTPEERMTYMKWREDLVKEKEEIVEQIKKTTKELSALNIQLAFLEGRIDGIYESWIFVKN